LAKSLTQRGSARWLLIASTMLIVAVTLVPFGGLRTSAEEMPATWCLKCGGLWLTDFISNIVLFTPFGAGLALLRGRARWWQLAAIAVTFSSFIEIMQSLGLPPGRSAALADVISNSMGGLTGLLLVRGWHYTRPRPSMATALALVWLVGACGTLLLTSLALGPRTHSSSETSYRLSHYSYAPGYGWFTGMPDSARVNGTAFVHRGSGPLVIEASVEPRALNMSITVRGRESTTATKPMLYVHTMQDTIAVGFIGNRGDDAVLSVTRRAWDWGLSLPSIRVRDAFRGRSLDDARPITLSAQAAPDRLALRATSEDFSGSSELVLPPTLGWTMIQTFIRFDSPFAFLAHVGWLAALVFPIGWWGAQAGNRRTALLLIAALAFCATALAAPAIFGVARVPMLEWLQIATLFAGAAVWGLRSAARVRADDELRPPRL